MQFVVFQVGDDGRADDAGNGDNNAGNGRDVAQALADANMVM